jgi:hypothetical protein
MTYLSRLTKLGLAKEAAQGTYLAPTTSVPWTTAEYSDATSPLRDESVRANDVVLQGLAQGVFQADWALTTNAYPDFIGNWFVALGMFDSVVAGAATTLSGNTTINATTLPVTSAVGITSGSILKISDTAGANVEYVQVGTPAGLNVPVTVGGGTGGNTTLYAHTAAGGAVVAQSTHTFKQLRTFSTVWPSYSFTTDDGAEQRGWAGCVCDELAIKIDPKGLIQISPKFIGWASSTQSTFSYAAAVANPMPGWAWTVTNGGASSTRGLTMDLTLKRNAEAVHASSGTRGPREVFAGALEADGAYKCIFENSLDINLFRTYIQQPTIHVLTQPIVQFGGSTLTLTMSVSGYVTAKVSTTGPYQQLDTTMSGVANTTDGNTGVGVISATLTNYSSTAY